VANPSSSVAAGIGAVVATTGFSGVVRVDRAGVTELDAAYGLADRRLGVAMTTTTRLGIASGTKAFTAVVVMQLVTEGALALATRVRDVLGRDLPLIDDRVTVEHLLTHRSGIGDYVDEEAFPEVTEHVMTVPVHTLATTEDYLAVLDGYPSKFAPAERFAYSNGGFVVLALIAERTSGVAFHELVEQRVCRPAGMMDTEYLRSDELPARTALGYVECDGVWRTNVFHLPVRGSGDGGIYSTAADISALWRAFVAGRIVSTEWVAQMVRPRSVVPRQSMRYGLGFWLHASTDAIVLEGCDAGVSFRSLHDQRAHVTVTVMSNAAEGAWPIARNLENAASS
jgi:CubicO group peptidase (beta-lactamase class C family)